MNPKKCIFCRLPKEKYNEEHVFPAALGGAFILLTVCQDCNTKLGKNIDNPLSQNKIILFFRKIYDIKRIGILGERNIKNPFTGTGDYLDDEGNNHYISFNEKEKRFEPIAVRKYEDPIQLEGGAWIGKMTLPLSEFKDEEEIKKKYTDKFNLDPSKIGSIKQTIVPQKEIKISLKTPSKDLMLGCVKIAYEYAMTFLPSYWDDEYSKMYSRILLTNSIEESEKIIFNSDPDVKLEFEKKMADIKDLKTFHHLAILATIKGKGLFCMVKIFNWMYAVKLSTKENYLKAKQLVLINDSISQAYWIDIPTKLKTFTISLDMDVLNRQRKRILESSKGTFFNASNGLTPVFDNKGKLIFRHLDQLAKEIQIIPQNYDHLNKKIIVPIAYPSGSFFLKHAKGNFLVPLKQVDFVYALKY